MFTMIGTAFERSRANVFSAFALSWPLRRGSICCYLLCAATVLTRTIRVFLSPFPNPTGYVECKLELVAEIGL